MKKSLALRFAAIPALLVATGSAFAVVPTEVTASVATMGTDGATIAGAVLVAIIAVLAIKFLRKGF